MHNINVSMYVSVVSHIESFHPRDRLHNNCYYPPYWCTTFSVQQQHKIKYLAFLSEIVHKFSLKPTCLLILYSVEAIAMVLCMIVGCSNKSGRHKVSFYRVPTVVKNQGEFMEELTAERRRKWISAVSREDLTDKILENDRVCGEHFVSGKPAASWDRHSIDWVPTLKLGHSKVKVKNPQAAAERAGRATKRRLQHEVDEERQAKMLNLAEPGETVKYIFTGTMPAEPQDLELSVNETEAGEADDDISDLQAHLSGHDHEMGIPDFVGLDGGARKAQNFAQDVATQTEEFDFMKYSNKPKPFDEDYFKNDDEKTRFLYWTAKF